jgi:hypothetical protein
MIAREVKGLLMEAIRKIELRAIGTLFSQS